MEVLFKTVHGSRLYGLAHENSDEDFYTIISKPPVDRSYGRQHKARYAKQTIIDGEDSVVLDFGTWIEQCKSGVPQALEAMFSNMAVEDHISDFRRSWRAGNDTYDRYFRTIKSFAMSDNDPFKRRRHSLRLALNLNELGRTGRFNPTLSKEDADYITRRARHRTQEEVYGEALCLAW